MADLVGPGRVAEMDEGQPEDKSTGLLMCRGLLEFGEIGY